MCVLICSRCREISTHVHPSIAFADFSSRAIDDRLSKMAEQNICIAYMYFDYNNSNQQTADYTTRCLLKQILHRLRMVPGELDELYKKYRRSSEQPKTSELVAQLMSASSHFSSAFIMLDALDECAHGNLNEVMDIIVHLRKSKAVKILCTSRVDTPGIRNNLGRPIAIEIEADMMDIRNYLSTRLDKEWKYEDEYKQEIEDTLTEHARKAAGKFVHLVIFLTEQVFAYEVPTGLYSRFPGTPRRT
jgi:hypothetical protein